MSRPQRASRSVCVIACLAGVALAACTGSVLSNEPDGAGRVLVGIRRVI